MAGSFPVLFHETSRCTGEESFNDRKANHLGWGVLPADVTIKGLTFYTALFPKDGGYLVPLKKDIRQKLEIELGDIVQAKIDFSMSGS